MPGPRMDPTPTAPTRMTSVFPGVPFPARSWQLVTWVDYHCAAGMTHAKLWELPS